MCDLAWISERSQGLVSHHLRVLKAHGLVRSRRDGKLVMYSLTDEGGPLRDGLGARGSLLPPHRLHAPIEERHLECTFGEEYRRYRTKVPRFLSLPRQR